MKASLQLIDSGAVDGDDVAHLRLFLRTKLPVSAVGLPLTVAATLGTRPADLSLRLTFSSTSGGPTLALSYHPHSGSPFAISLKSGVGLFGSPVDSPLVLSARFELARPDAAPAFSLHLRPRFGHFYLKRSIFSSTSNETNPSATDISVLASSKLPVGAKSAVRLRWRVNFPAELDKGSIFLTFDKLSLEKVEDGVVPAAVLSTSAPVRGDAARIREEFEGMKRENESMKKFVGEMKSAARGAPARMPPEKEKGTELERWRSIN